MTLAPQQVQTSAKIILEFDINSWAEKKHIDQKPFHEIPTGEEWRIPLVNELVGIRDGSLTSIGWSNDKIKNALEFLLTT